jgi:single-stranded-DNA-specific exonuclease
VLSALRAELKQRDWFTAQGLEMPNLGDALDLVALGTVADVVPLDRNNRILVAGGLGAYPIRARSPWY